MYKNANQTEHNFEALFRVLVFYMYKYMKYIP